MQRCGLLFVAGSTPFTLNFQLIRRTFRLLVEEMDDQDPRDLAYTYSGYAPISCRLVEALHRASTRKLPDRGQLWLGLEEALKLLPGVTFEEVQRPPHGVELKKASSGSDAKVTAVLFVGGCCSAEVSALRFLSAHEEGQTEYLILTTQMLNGNTLVSSLTSDAAAAKPLASMSVATAGSSS